MILLKSTLKILFTIFVISLVLLLGACSEIDLSEVDLSELSEEDIDKIITCKTPYMRFEAGCCLDLNANDICDEHEGILPEEEEEAEPEEEVPTDCDADINTDVNNCGSCGNVCDFPNAMAACAEGACVFVSCEEGYTDCDDATSNGCEANTDTDMANCGSCGNICDIPYAVESCTDGVCTIVSCDNGHEDCDGMNSNGCEVDTNTDMANCGGCSMTCLETESCTGGVCTSVGCSEGYADCDLNPDNGCEVNLNTDPSNCGGCNNVCTNEHGTAACSDGICVPECESDYADCDLDPDNGCETVINTLDNCGSCGNACSETQACTSGVCTTPIEMMDQDMTVQI